LRGRVSRNFGWCQEKIGPQNTVKGKWMMEVGRWRNSGVSRRRPSKDENFRKLELLGHNPKIPLPRDSDVGFQRTATGLSGQTWDRRSMIAPEYLQIQIPFKFQYSISCT
jgi:hypothetical protein